MYANAAILAAVVLIYSDSAFAGRVVRSWLSGPMLFTAPVWSLVRSASTYFDVMPPLPVSTAM
jgi:hypothetical protein